MSPSPILLVLTSMPASTVDRAFIFSCSPSVHLSLCPSVHLSASFSWTRYLKMAWYSNLKHVHFESWMNWLEFGDQKSTSLWPQKTTTTHFFDHNLRIHPLLTTTTSNIYCDKMMTLYIQNIKGQLHCNIIMFSENTLLAIIQLRNWSVDCDQISHQSDTELMTLILGATLKMWRLCKCCLDARCVVKHPHFIIFSFFVATSIFKTLSTAMATTLCSLKIIFISPVHEHI